MHKKVDFFIVGAPKCGTTALVEYLNATNEVFVPPIKEPHFFCFEWPEFQRVRTFDEYHALYDRSGNKLCGDASVWYLYSKESAKNIKNYNDEAKIIIMLREPVAAMQSLHSQLLFSGREDVNDFTKAVNLESERSKGNFLPKNSIVNEHLLYSEVYSYEEQVSRYIELFGEENCKIVLYEDFFKSVESGLTDVMSFLGLNLKSAEGVELKKVNSNRVHRFPRIAHFVMRPPGFLGVVKEWLKNTSLMKRRPIMRPVYRFFSEGRKRRSIDSSQISLLRKGFEEKNIKLKDVAKVDISKW